MNQSHRLTIGVLIGTHLYAGARPYSFAATIMRGIQAAAKDKQVNMMIGCGMFNDFTPGRYLPVWPELEGDSDFAPIGPWNTDGLIFLAPVNRKEHRDYIRHLDEGGFPVICVGSGIGQPAVFVDNEAGIRQVMEHLVSHRLREIAFIAGDDKDPGDTVFRLNAYKKGLAEFHLHEDPRLVVYGLHTELGGYRATRRLLESGVQFQAVMCSNDISAIGSMKALREAGKRIPEDVSVTGFDDILECQACVPALTSVHYPLFEAGYRALLHVLQRIEQGRESIPDTTYVSTRLTPRQSCGCLPELVAKSILDGNSIANEDLSSLSTLEQWMARSMCESLSREGSRIRDVELTSFCNRLASVFLRSLESRTPEPFRDGLIEALQEIEGLQEENPSLWQLIISPLREGAYIFEKNRPEKYAEDLLHLAWAIFGESAHRRHARLQVKTTLREENIGLLTTRLISNSEADQIFRILRGSLPQVGVKTCHISYFRPQGSDPVAMSELHSYDQDETISRFETRTFPPVGLFPPEAPFNLAMLPLVFQEEKFGYVIFDGEDLDPLATLARQLSSSFQNARLHAKVLELSLTDELTALHNRRFFDLQLLKETDRSNRYKRDLAVVMIDIDHFKEYNDAFGHPAGDEALREIARSIQLGSRRGLDMAARYGGEEFALLLPEMDADGAWLIAEDIRKRVEADAAFLRPSTVSIGISARRGDWIEPSRLVDQADRALYQSKRLGRNRTTQYAEGMRKSRLTATREEKE